MLKTAGIFWDDKKGPIENMMLLGELGAVAFGGIWTKAVILLANALGMSATSLGRLLDEALGFKKVEDALALSPDEAAKKATTTLFDVSEEVLTAESALYRQHLKKFAQMEQGLVNQVPLSLNKNAKIPSGLMKSIRGKNMGSGFLGWFFEKIKSLFSFIWRWLSRLAIGGLGSLGLVSMREQNKETQDMAEPNREKVVVEEEWSPFSTKKEVNPYKQKLELKVEEIFGE